MLLFISLFILSFIKHTSVKYLLYLKALWKTQVKDDKLSLLSRSFYFLLNVQTRHSHVECHKTRVNLFLNSLRVIVWQRVSEVGQSVWVLRERWAQGKYKRILTGLCGTQGRVLKPLVSTSVPLWSNGLA